MAPSHVAFIRIGDKADAGFDTSKALDHFRYRRVSDALAVFEAMASKNQRSVRDTAEEFVCQSRFTDARWTNTCDQPAVVVQHRFFQPTAQVVELKITSDHA